MSKIKFSIKGDTKAKRSARAKTILKTYDDIASHNRSSGTGAPPYAKPMFPLVIELVVILYAFRL